MDGEQLGFGLPEYREVEGPLFDPERIRAEAMALIAEARSANRDGPWDIEALQFRRMLFPHLVSWLPEEAEREQLCFEFVQELERIEQLLAA